MGYGVRQPDRGWWQRKRVVADMERRLWNAGVPLDRLGEPAIVRREGRLEWTAPVDMTGLDVIHELLFLNGG